MYSEGKVETAIKLPLLSFGKIKIPKNSKMQEKDNFGDVATVLDCESEKHAQLVPCKRQKMRCT